MRRPMPERDTPEPNQLRILAALQAPRRHVYAGTVPAAEKARRRASNRVARRSRRANRRS